MEDDNVEECSWQKSEVHWQNKVEFQEATPREGQPPDQELKRAVGFRTRASRTSPDRGLLPTCSWASPVYLIVNCCSRLATFCARGQNESSRATGPSSTPSCLARTPLPSARAASRLPSLSKPELLHSGGPFIHRSRRHGAFKSWKEKVEKDTRSRYVVTTSAKKGSPQGKETTYYSCHRSGTFVPQGTGKKKQPPSLKCGRRCFAGMTVTKSNTGVNVVFQSKHRGHDFELRHVLLSKTERSAIAAKLQEGVSLDAVLDGVRQHLDGTFQRVNLLTRQDLHNIMRDNNIINHERLHSNDYISVQLWVERMHAEKDNPVLFFKHQGQPDKADILDRPPHDLLDEKDFMLAIMTEPQQELFKKLGTDRVCIYGTHGTTGFDFQLVTVLVVDEFGTGFPVAYCITNRTDRKAMATFFASIMSKTGQIAANVFMTDDAPSFYNAWTEVMGPPQHRLLCAWHVDKNWRESANKYIQDKTLRAFTYKVSATAANRCARTSGSRTMECVTNGNQAWESTEGSRMER
ncbi:uncharacterized protein LOC119462611 [Dermacentor silvarum]|uniref:uncharacterized protein LOC119462611 n=1 Tax=Dermacentor silvarum TaxID=543639 RepID=UPI0021018780|nr:uncharacterized protein LOC119462611 [Dermacentor silvarum]